MKEQTVFIVLREVAWQGDEILGVFCTYESAMKYATSCKGQICVQEWSLQ